MAQNPLQQYFRQPKIYISLPSMGVYNKPGTIEGDPLNIPVYGMTGLDEIMIKTPDALLSGESTVKVIESCCPSIKDAWEVNNIDLDLLLVAIRIATFGNAMAITHTCNKCGAENDYSIELGTLIEHYSKCQYNNTIKMGSLTIKLQPINYKQATDFALRNFRVQQRLVQATAITDDDERNAFIKEIFKEMAQLQYEVFAATIDSVDTGEVNVSDPAFIREWLDNADKSVFDAMKAHNEINKKAWETPKFPVKCNACEHESETLVEMDHSSFFAGA